jgi:hypothetical protein
MARLRVKYGTGCGAVAQEHAARISIDLACSVVAPATAGRGPAVLSFPCSLAAGLLTSRSQIRQCLPWPWASRRATNSSRNTTFGPPASPRCGSYDRPCRRAQEVASIENEPDRIVYCCERGARFILAYRLYEWKKAVEADQAAIAAKVEDLADRGGVGLTPHAVAVDRAMAAVAKVSETLAGSTDDLQELNGAFKKSRKAEPGIRYADYLDARKAAMLQTPARS